MIKSARAGSGRWLALSANRPLIEHESPVGHRTLEIAEGDHDPCREFFTLR